MPAPTIKDVAEYAGVSGATVSRVLNNHHTVDEVLRSRVLAAVKALGYQPNRAARKLRARASSVMGLIISDIQNPYFISVIRGVEDAAYAAQMSIVLCNSDEDLARQQMYLQIMEAEQVAGLIIVPASSTDDAGLQRLKAAGIPIILLDRVVDALTVDAVKVDNERGAYDAVKHLLDQGYRRIAMIGGSTHLTTGRERYSGYRAALAAAGVIPDEELIRTGNFRTETGYQITRDLVRLAEPPEALFIANNVMTLGALRALRELGVRVPDEMPVACFDDMPWSAELYSPLTAVSQPTYELGQEAVHLLLRRLEEPEAPFRTVVLQTHLIVRDSSGASLRSQS